MTITLWVFFALGIRRRRGLDTPRKAASASALGPSVRASAMWGGFTLKRLLRRQRSGIIFLQLMALIMNSPQ
jgi:hypothetical protein